MIVLIWKVSWPQIYYCIWSSIVPNICMESVVIWFYLYGVGAEPQFSVILLVLLVFMCILNVGLFSAVNKESSSSW